MAGLKEISVSFGNKAKVLKTTSVLIDNHARHLVLWIGDDDLVMIIKPEAAAVLDESLSSFVRFNRQHPAPAKSGGSEQ